MAGGRWTYRRNTVNLTQNRSTVLCGPNPNRWFIRIRNCSGGTVNIDPDAASVGTIAPLEVLGNAAPTWAASFNKRDDGGVLVEQGLYGFTTGIGVVVAVLETIWEPEQS